MITKQIMICDAIIDMLKIFADTEIGGQYEINYEVLSQYVESIRCVSDYFEANTKEEIYERFTKDIYARLPVWQFLILPEWTRKMVEKSFAEDVKQTEEEFKKKYKCFTCKYFKMQETSIGMFYDCKYEEMNTPITRRFGTYGREHRVHKRQEPFELKKRCNKWEVNENE